MRIQPCSRLGERRLLGMCVGAVERTSEGALSSLPLLPQDVSALVVSVAMLLEPVAGGAIGWAVGVQVGPVSGCTQTTLGPGDMSFVQGPPSPLTLVAAPVLLLGAAGVIVGAREGGMSQRLKQALCRCRSKRPAATVPMEPHAHSISGAAEGVDAPSTDSHPAPCQCDSEASPLASFT